MVTAKQVQQLRQMTNCGMMECKKALEEAMGNIDKAAEILRISGAAKVVKKSGRSTEQGIIESYIHAGGKVGVLLKLNCETDFVASNELFGRLAHDLAMHIAAMNPMYVNAEDIPEEVKENERRIYKDQFSGSGKPEEIISKIIEGKMQNYAAEVALLEQAYVKDQDKKVKDIISEYISKLGENIRVGGFVRYEI
jgi:elongation factor Ts